MFYSFDVDDKTLNKNYLSYCIALNQDNLIVDKLSISFKIVIEIVRRKVDDVFHNAHINDLLQLLDIYRQTKESANL